MLPGRLDELAGLFQLHRLQQESGGCVRRILHFVLGGAAGVHAELAVSRGIQHFGRVGQHGVVHAHVLQHAFHHAVVAEVGFEAGHDVDLAVLAGLLAFHGVQREVADDAFEHVVPAGDMRTHERRGVRERCREVLGNVARLLGVADEGVQVVTDDFGHTGRRHGDHVRLVQRLGVLQAVDHVLLAAEHGCVFGHGVGHARDGLAEVTVEVGAEVGHATLRTVHVRHGLFETQRTQHGAQRLAGLGRIHGQRFALEVQLAILHRGRPLEGLFDLLGVVTFFEQLLFVAQCCLVFILTEQGITRFDVIDFLHFCLLGPSRLSADTGIS